MSTDEPITVSSATEADDVHCLRCGYNLFGLSGDPIRCPECGHDNIAADLRLPPELLERKLTDLCRAGECAALGILMAAAPLLAWTWNGLRRLLGLAMGFDVPITLRIGVVMMIFGLPVAWSQVKAFRTLCHGRHGWERALVRYCAYGGLIGVWFVIVQVAMMPLASFMTFRTVRGLVFMGSTLAMVSGSFFITAWIHRRIGQEARWLVQGRDRTQDAQFWFWTDEDRELFRKAIKERDERRRQESDV